MGWSLRPKRRAIQKKNGLIEKNENELYFLHLNGNPVFSNESSNLLRNPPDWIIFDELVFDNLISADVWLGKD